VGPVLVWFEIEGCLPIKSSTGLCKISNEGPKHVLLSRGRFVREFDLERFCPYTVDSASEQTAIDLNHDRCMVSPPCSGYS